MSYFKEGWVIKALRICIEVKRYRSLHIIENSRTFHMHSSLINVYKFTSRPCSHRIRSLIIHRFVFSVSSFFRFFLWVICVFSFNWWNFFTFDMLLGKWTIIISWLSFVNYNYACSEINKTTWLSFFLFLPSCVIIIFEFFSLLLF